MMASNHMTHNPRSRQMLAGVLLAAAGVFLMIQQAFPLSPLAWARFWPIIVIAMGASRLWRGFQRRDGKAGWGLMWMLMGSLLMLHTQHIVSARQSWPLFIVAHGIGLLLQGWFGAPRRPEVPNGR